MSLAFVHRECSSGRAAFPARYAAGRWWAHGASVGALLGLLIVTPSVVRAAATPLEDCGPDQLWRADDSISRADVERRCTHVIARGNLGPFHIGDDKQHVLDELPSDGVQTITLVSAYRGVIPVEDPDAAAVLRSSKGILVEAHDIPDPLRLEFVGDRLSRLFGGAPELDDLRAELRMRFSKAEVLRVLRAQPRRLGLSIRAFVPRGEAIVLPTTAEVRNRVLEEDHWLFDASPSLCGFDAFYSRVELVFAAGRLVRVEHFCFPFELP